MTVLAFLSIQRTSRTRCGVAQVPSNDDRLRAYRALGPIHIGNNLPWKWRQVADEAAPGPEYDNNLREGFALKYGSSDERI